MQTITATDAKNSFGELMSLIEQGPVSITKNGRIVATMSSVKPDKASISEAEIYSFLKMYADGLMDRRDVQDETGLAFDEILQQMRKSELTLPVVRTYNRYNEEQKALYEAIFQP